MDKVLVTGGAGFIGSHLVERLLGLGHTVVCLDNLEDLPSSPRASKLNNLRSMASQRGFVLAEGDIRDQTFLSRVFSSHKFDAVVHLAALSGVRESVAEVGLYEEVNIRGTANLLEETRGHGVKKLVFASSAAVYGDNPRPSLSEGENTDSPISPYAVSKATGELLCYCYSHNYALATVALRFFTVYGPRQKPGMAVHLFTKLMDEGKEVTVYGDGTSVRDYTYVGDVVAGIEAALAYRGPKFDVFNLASGRAVSLNELVSVIEMAMGKKARVAHLPPQPGDVQGGEGDISKAQALLGYRPAVDIRQGVSLFVEWYKAGLPRHK